MKSPTLYDRRRSATDCFRAPVSAAWIRPVFGSLMAFRKVILVQYLVSQFSCVCCEEKAMFHIKWLPSQSGQACYSCLGVSTIPLFQMGLSVAKAPHASELVSTFNLGRIFSKLLVLDPHVANHVWSITLYQLLTCYSFEKVAVVSPVMVNFPRDVVLQFQSVCDLNLLEIISNSGLPLLWSPVHKSDINKN